MASGKAEREQGESEDGSWKKGGMHTLQVQR